MRAMLPISVAILFLHGIPAAAQPAGEAPASQPVTPPASTPASAASEPEPPASAPSGGYVPVPPPKPPRTAGEPRTATRADLQARYEVFSRGPFSLRVGGMIQLQGAFYVGADAARQFDDPADTEGFRLRRVRLGFSGQFLPDFEYYFALDLKDVVGAATGGDTGNEILDAYVRWNYFDWLNVSAGVDRVAFSTFSLMSSARLNLIERPLASEALAPDRRVGLTVSGQVGTLSYATGVYNGSNGATTGNQLAGIAAAAWVRYDVFRPTPQFVPREPELGISAAYMYDNQAAVDLHRAAAGVDAAWFGVRLTGEFIWEHSTPDAEPGGVPDAGAVSRWSATSELSAFVWSKYLQLAARYEYFRDNEELPTFGRQQLISGGVNAYLYEHRLKLQINYIRRDELEGPEIANDIGFAQLQGMF